MKESISPSPEIAGPSEDRKRKVYTVSQLNREVRNLLEATFVSLWVEGEISNFKRHSSGHMYLSLKDEKAQIPAVFFSRQNAGLKFELKDGLQVLVFGKISLYEPRGQFQLYVERVEPKGMGALQLAFLQLKDKLEREGLFHPQRKKPIPKFPSVVGIITSPTGAAIRDILNVINRRFHGTHLLLNPVRVQGEGAAKEIVRAIEEMNQIGGIDVLIVGRGGGSLEDLWAFNEEILARAVFASRIPIISAVGHEIDWTICDLVADLRASTPSAAAELVVQNREELLVRLRDFQTRMMRATTGVIEGKRDQLHALEESYAFKQPRQAIEQFAQRVDELLRQLQNYLKAFVQGKKQSFETLAGQLGALSPLAILGRGYSLTFKSDGTLVRDLAFLKIGDSLRTKLARGILDSRITKIEESKGECDEGKLSG